MRTKLEARLDKEFRAAGVKVYVYHLNDCVRMFSGITIATGIRQDKDALWQMIEGFDRKCIIGAHDDQIDAPATWMRKELAARGFCGVALCDYRDQFSRKRGRIIAKGRLLKYMRRQEEQDYQQEVYAQIEYENRDIEED